MEPQEEETLEVTKDDVDRLDTMLASPQFNPVAFVNQVFPTEESLGSLPEKISQLSQRTRRINQTIRQSVRSYGVLGDSSEQILINTIKTIQTLTRKITSIHDQAAKTETVVSDLCGSIKPLHNARKNLQESIKAVEQFRMITSTVEQLEDSIINKDYGECARNLAALSDLLEVYQKYKETPQLKPLFDKYNDQKRTLRTQITTSFNETIFRGSADESFLPICACIDAFNDDFHDSVVELFCNRLLETYDNAFSPESSGQDLKYVSRFNWFKNRIDFFNQKYGKAFPEEWQMNYHLSKTFCTKTCLAFKQILNSWQSPKTSEYLAAFEKTVKFETKLQKQFSRLVVLPFDPNAVMPDFPMDAEGIKKKYEWKKRQEEGVGEVITEEATEFKGLIASAFAPQLSIYLDSERQKFETIISKSGKAEDFDEDDLGHKLKSETTLILAMKTTIDKCAGFGDAQALLDLFVVLKDKLGDYTHHLTELMESLLNQIKRKQIFKNKKEVGFTVLTAADKEQVQEALRKQCYALNTSTEVLDLVGTLCKKIQSLVQGDLKEAIIITDALETIGNEIHVQLDKLVKTIMRVLNAQLAKVGDNTWTETDPSLKLPKDLIDSLDFLFTILTTYLTDDNKKLRFSPIFSSELIKAVSNSLMKCKNISIDSASRILMSIKELKAIVLQKTQVVRLAAQQVNKQFNNFEAQLTVICSPEIAMVPTYLGKMGKHAKKEEFLSLVKVRGLGLEKETEMAKSYDKQLVLFQ